MIMRLLALWWVFVAILTIAGVDVGAITVVCACFCAALLTWNLGDK
jgi:hypothetical protein